MRQKKVHCKLDLDTKTWEKFGKIVKPLSRSAAVTVMVKAAVEAEDKPLGKVIEDILLTHVSGRPS